jgi:hypothetical protein
MLLPKRRTPSELADRIFLLTSYFAYRLGPEVGCDMLLPKRRTPSELHGVTTQQTVLFVGTAARTTNATRYEWAPLSRRLLR